MSFSLAGSSGSYGGIDTASSPSGVALVHDLDHVVARPARRPRANVAIACRSAPTRRQTVADVAPVPLASDLRHPRQHVAGDVGLADRLANAARTS